MADQDLPDAPDLASEGFPSAHLHEGALAPAIYEGERIVLLRLQGRVYALEGACKHYGAPLDEGVFDGVCIRCPWHHARFDVQTGAHTAPAYKPAQRYATVERDGRIFVTGPVSEPARQHEPIEAAPSSIVIVGGGAAGHMAAETLRNEGYAGPVTILSDDAWPPYDRPNLSKDYLAGSAGEDWLDLRDADFYRERQIEIRTGARVTRIDPERHSVTLASGEEVPYGELLLAPGAAARRLPIEGMDLPHVKTLRDRSDCEAIIAALRPGGRVAVIGASFIGMEVAASLRKREIPVAVIAPESQPMELVLGPEVGARMRRLHEEHGVEFHLGRKPARVEADRVVLDDGSSVEAAAVVVGVGVVPRLELAESAGLAIDRGIIVNEYLETSAPGIWAAGDAAAWPDPHSGSRLRIEHWTVAQRQGAVAARNILGRRLPFAEVPFFWSDQLGLTIAYVGHAAGWDAVTIKGDLDADDALVAYRKDGKIVAVATIFRDRDSLQAEIAFERGDQPALEALVRA
jgi:NADPH-dependent 2,4-dienoyl-CoA reductase/sulfur reductase-like enzyme/nitrite reductase/ring-hydroxylating ferredoxin subunit